MRKLEVLPILKELDILDNFCDLIELFICAVLARLLEYRRQSLLLVFLALCSILGYFYLIFGLFTQI